MGNDKSNIAIGLPNPKGALYWAPLGTTLPTDATTPLASEFVNLGYVTEDGLTSTTAEEGMTLKLGVLKLSPATRQATDVTLRLIC